MDIRRDLLAEIEDYLATTGMSATTFGRQALNDGNFVQRLREGRGLTARTYARVEAFIRATPATGRRAPAGQPADLAQTIRTLRAHRQELQAAGIEHVAVFGSVARGEASADSDVDVLIELAPTHHVGLFRLARLKRDIAQIVPGADVVDKSSVHPAIADRINDDAIYAF